MPASLDSSRPIMAPSLNTPSPRASNRFSTYSVAPSITPTVKTTDSANAEVDVIEQGLTRMENKALTQQRVVLSEEKAGNLNKLALGAKLDRALERRMTGQDAVMKPKKRNEDENEKAHLSPKEDSSDEAPETKEE